MSRVMEKSSELSSAAPQAAPLSRGPVCRSCGKGLEHTFVDLGTSPLCQRHVTPENFDRAEAFYPQHVYVCDACWLVQLPEYVAASEIFDDQYAYFSSFSDTWLRHAAEYCDLMTQKLGLNSRSLVVELASNDGYLLKNFVAKKIPVLGIEPTANTAAAAEKIGVPSLVKFFGRQTARQVLDERGPASLILGNNVLAHVPDLNDFIGGMKILLAPDGVITMEFPHLLQLMRDNLWDTIYHEHFSYLSLTAVETAFARHDLVLFDVDHLPTHGGSLRIYCRHRKDTSKPVTARVDAQRTLEAKEGLTTLAGYAAFDEKVKETKRKLLEFLIQAKRQGKSVCCYGAPGKGNTLLNYCGIRTDFVDYTVDRSPHKQGNFLPGTRIPIYHPDKIAETKPDYVLILPWNLKDEIVRQMAHVREWGGEFVIPLPEVRVVGGRQ